MRDVGLEVLHSDRGYLLELLREQSRRWLDGGLWLRRGLGDRFLSIDGPALGWFASLRKLDHS